MQSVMKVPFGKQFFAAENKLKNLICIVDRNRLSVTKKIDSEIVLVILYKK